MTLGGDGKVMQMKSAKYLLSYVLYYCVLIHLPRSIAPLGWLWRAMREKAVRHLLKSAGREINIERGANFGGGRQVTLGDRSGIGAFAQLVGPVKIGCNVMMGPEVLVMTQNHRIDQVDVPMIEQGLAQPLPVVIEDDVWVGARAIILPGVRIGTGSVVAAGAVVTRSVPPMSVVGGNPARLIRARDAERSSRQDGAS